jgi:hypothetical protein
MSLFEDRRYQWRETYFVFFDPDRRPKLETLQNKLDATAGTHFSIANPATDARGRIESVTIFVPDDFAAMDISFLSGAEVREEARDLANELSRSSCPPEKQKDLERLKRCQARFDVLHFEQTSKADDEDEDLFDPSGLLIVLEALIELTDGIAIDPQSGTMF